MTEGKQYREQVLSSIPPLTEDKTWHRIQTNGQQPIECERFGICGEDATWTTEQGNLHVCDYHRFLFDILRTVNDLNMPELRYFKVPIPSFAPLSGKALR
jgi:hypothetical protein